MSMISIWIALSHYETKSDIFHDEAIFNLSDHEIKPDIIISNSDIVTSNPDIVKSNPDIIISNSEIIILESHIVKSNEEYLQISKINSQMLIRNKTITDSSQIECLPKSFGVSIINDSIFFPKKYVYFGCSKKAHGKLKVINNQISFDCNGKNESFIFDEDSTEEILGRYQMNFTRKSIDDYKDTMEWFFAKCDNNVLAYLENKFNQSAAQRARSIQEQLCYESNNTDRSRPLTVIMLMLDSVSRQSFFRNLKKTVDYLNNNLVSNTSVFGEKFVLYDFLINNAQGRKTVLNMVPILYGKTASVVDNHLVHFSINDKKDWHAFEDFQKKSILNYFKEHGFVTLFSFDSYSDSLSYYTGRNILILLKKNSA